MLKTGHRTKYHLRAFEFLAARRRSRAVLTCTLLASFLATMPTGGLQAGDILRGGASASNAKRNSEARANAGAAAAEAAKVRAQDRLARTTKAVNDMRALQASARAAAGANSIPNGLTTGGLQPQLKTGVGIKAIYTKDDFQNWEGADAPTVAGNNVKIKQTASQALLHWDTFNVGSQTTVNFDQSAGGADSGKWIAFNKVLGTAAPSQIRGKINAQGQVYIINQNGIIFGAGSQVNARTLVASALPINDNLLKNGLLNNKDAQFLFSGLDVPGGSDGTPSFNPTPLPAGVRYGDVVVERGALLETPASADGNGGRVMLVGANVRNEGTISTPAGQSILAAGLQVGIQSHKGDDPSLRGLDVWVGNIGEYAGNINNSGLIEAKTGSIVLTGKNIYHSGILESSTSVSLNGRIDIFASYGAVGNPGFDNSTSQGSGFSPFIPQFTGLVDLSPSSVIRILPSSSSSEKIPGTRLPEVSQVNFLGNAIHFGENSIVLAPNAKSSIRAGRWAYSDTNMNRLADDPFLKENLQRLPSGRLEDYPIWGYTSSLLYSEGQVYFDKSSLFDVSGSTGAFVSIKDYIVDVQFRGNELADSPLQRTSTIRGKTLTVDLRKSGSYAGTGWVGSPLGDLNGIAGIIAKDAAQLTAAGGEISITAGESIVLASGATLDVSGGSFQYEGGKITTSRLLRNGVLIPIEEATPDRTYDSVANSQSQATSAKWGVLKNFEKPLAPMGSYYQPSYIGGAPAGTIRLTAPGLLVSGELVGQSVNGPRQRDTTTGRSLLKLSFGGEKNLNPGGAPTFVYSSPTPPTITAAPRPQSFEVPAFEMVSDAPKAVPASYLTSFTLPSSLYEEDEGGFGSIQIKNEGGDFVLESKTEFEMTPGSGLKADIRNANISGHINAPGGTVSITSYNYAPYDVPEVPAGSPPPSPLSGMGIISIRSGASISVAGNLIDDRPTSPQIYRAGKNIDGGSILLTAYKIQFEEGSTLDASSGAYFNTRGKRTNGNGGKIQLYAGIDPGLSTSIGESLEMRGTLKGYGFGKGGTLALKSTLVQIGGNSAPSDTLLLNPSFFQNGGFSNFEVNGIGGRTAEGAMRPAIKLLSGTTLEPRTENLVTNPYGGSRGLPSTSIVLKPEGLRPAASITLKARGMDDGYVNTSSGEDKIEALGLIVLEKGSKISTDAGASVALDGDAVFIDGSISAPGGKISVTGKSKFFMPSSLATDAKFALPTVYIGNHAVISAAGKSIATPDPFGRKAGLLYPGGTIEIKGNILAEAGAILDVSGSSAEFDLHPTRTGQYQGSPKPSVTGVTTQLWPLLTNPTRVDSNGGTIRLSGSEFLYSSATLSGAAGGPSALGGTLIVSSGRFYGKNEFKKGSDINLVSSQALDAIAFGGFSNSGSLIKSLFLGGGNIETSIADAFSTTKSQPGIGYFAMDQFAKGGFDSLDLNFYLNRGSPTLGGNIEFQGPVSLSARGFVRLAGGGVIKADSTVSLQASYIAIGQEFRPPLNPSDTTENAIVNAFEEEATGGGSKQELVAPESGPGRLDLKASLIDLGTLTLKGISKANLLAEGGDIRGSGTFSIAGELSLTAAQIYPTTLATLDIFAYDGAEVSGKVSISSSGTGSTPLSAGGSLRVFAKNIQQAGVLRAPFGSITLGWDGLDTDPTDSDLDAPVNSGLGNLLTTPTSESVTLTAGSSTSVSGIDPHTGTGIVVPFGLSADGLSWLDPRGVNVTTSGLPKRSVRISAGSITTEAGSQIDLRGGGDLLAYRWLPGIGGTSDILGLGANTWLSKSSYSAGDLVLYGGSTWSARVAIDPEKIFEDTTPALGKYWKILPESYAILPGFKSNFAPYNAFNTAENASGLGGAQGYVSSSLRTGQKISLSKGSALPEGTYTLLPRRYGVFPGAYLVIPTDGGLRDSSSVFDTGALGFKSAGLGTEVVQETGSSFVSGYTFNFLHGRDLGTPARRTFEVLSPKLLAERASYATYSANTFIPEAAERLAIANRQTIPIDSGYLSLSTKTAFNLSGQVLGKSISSGYGASADIASLANMVIQGERSSTPTVGSVGLRASLLNTWELESLILGGSRQLNADGSYSIRPRNQLITIDNSQTPLSAPDLMLASSGSISILSGSKLLSSGPPNLPPTTLKISGDGTTVRLSGLTDASTLRTDNTSSTAPLLEIGAGVSLRARSLTLDSSYASNIDANLSLQTENLSLRSGQISISQATPSLTGATITPHLVISGSLLQSVSRVQSLDLQSYRTIDIYGDGLLGGTSLSKLSLQANGIRGFDSGPSGFQLAADDLTLSNTGQASALPDSTGTGSLELNASVIRLGAKAFKFSGFSQIGIQSRKGLVASESGSLTTNGDLTITTPLVASAASSVYSISATGEMNLVSYLETPTISKGFGATLNLSGASINMGTQIDLPSGLVTLRSTAGDLTISGTIKAENISKSFQDVTKSTDAGEVRLTADAGNVVLQNQSLISVSATTGDGAAGRFALKAPLGSLTALGTFRSTTLAPSAKGGSFSLDVGTIASYSDVRDKLTAGGFTESWNMRLRNGSWNLSGAAKASNLVFSTDTGDISIDGNLNASGKTGGEISFYSKGSIQVKSGANLNVRGQFFSHAGKGGVIRLEAGSSDALGSANLAGFVTLESGATLDLGVDAFQPGDYSQSTSSEFTGKFQGKLQIRAPRNGSAVNVNPLLGTITDVSAITVEAFQTYLPSGGTLNNAIRDTIHSDNSLYLTNTNDTALRTSLLAGNPSASSLDAMLVIMPGVELINPSGSLTLGTAGTNSGTPVANDWDLSSYRYGTRNAPGVLTLRAKNDILVLNALSDGFKGLSTINGGADKPTGSRLWLAELMNLNPDIPRNSQSWSYRITSGADLTSANPSSVLASGTGSVKLGNFYSNTALGGTGSSASTLAAIASTSNSRFQVIRTGAGDITISTGGDFQLRNQFATVYSAGVRLPQADQVFTPGDFSVPIMEPSQNLEQDPLGAPQQVYAAQWALGGGDIRVESQGSMSRITRASGVEVVDSSRQLPTNWLYRRGQIDPSTGLFSKTTATDGNSQIEDPSSSTAWWVDFSNFFQGLGAFAGGNIALKSYGDITNIDAFIPTTARMPGLASGAPILPDASRLVEYGGGDLKIQADGDLSGGIFYLEKGTANLRIGGAITTNQARSPSRYLISNPPEVFDPLVWLPTTFFAGRTQIDVSAKGDVLLGPTANAFLLPQGLNNKFWYKTYFQTLDSDSALSVTSLGGNINHRHGVVMPTSSTPVNTLQAWLNNQNRFSINGGSSRASNTQPWIRIAETTVESFATSLSVTVPTIKSTAFSGNIELTGTINLFPSPKGTLELLANGAITGLNPLGRATLQGTPKSLAWATSKINLSDADPNLLPGIASPYAFQSLVKSIFSDVLYSTQNGFLDIPVGRYFKESGAVTGANVAIDAQQSLHASSPLHQNDTLPLRLHALGGDVSGMTLFSSKFVNITAARDVTDLSLYLQNASSLGVSIVSAGRDVIPYNENSERRSLATIKKAGDAVVDPLASTVLLTASGARVSSRILAGDIQVSGPGNIEILAGRNIDLGTGPNFLDGTGVGITTIGKTRNPFLPAEGANVILFAGMASKSAGASLGILGSMLDLTAAGLASSTPLNEAAAITAYKKFFGLLRQAGDEYLESGSYASGFQAISALYGKTSTSGEVFTRARDIRTTSGGGITISIPEGGLTMASTIFGNPLTPPGIVTEYGGEVAMFTHGNVDIGQARIFTLRGGDLTIWSSAGNIAAGTAAKTVVTAPPTRVLIDSTSADVVTDLGGLATGGGIGVLASVQGVEAGNVSLLAPFGTVDAGDAGIRATGNIKIAAAVVLNADNIAAGGSSVGVPSAPTVAAPNVGGLTSGSSSSAAANSAASQVSQQAKPQEKPADESPSLISVEILGYGGGEGGGGKEDEEENKSASL